MTKASRTTLVAFLALLFGLVILSYQMIAPYLIAVFVGGILAIIARPLFRRLSIRLSRPKLAASIVTFFVVVVVALPITVFSLSAIKQGSELARDLLGQQDMTLRRGLEFVTAWPPLQDLIGDAAAIESQLRSGLQKIGSIASSSLIGFFGSLTDAILQAVLALLSCYFFLLDGRIFFSWLQKRVPLDSQVKTSVFTAFKEAAISSIWSTIIAALVQATIMLIAFLVLGVPGAFLASGSTFIFAWIPIVGSTPVWLAGAIFLYLKGSVSKCIIMLVFGVITSISDNITRPWVLKGQSEMHPLVGLVAILGGLKMFGIFGVFIGPIVAALLIATLQIWPVVAERFGLIQTENPNSD